MIIAIDLWSIIYVTISIPILILLCRIAWSYFYTIKHITQNKYVSKIIKENNQVWRDYLELQEELKKVNNDGKQEIQLMKNFTMVYVRIVLKKQEREAKFLLKQIMAH